MGSQPTQLVRLLINDSFFPKKNALSETTGKFLMLKTTCQFELQVVLPNLY